MKAFTGTIALCLIIGSVIFGITQYQASVKFRRQFGAYWSLSVKASTIDQKLEYLNQFISNIESRPEMFAEHGAVIGKTLNNSFVQNMKALKSLQSRLKKMLKMDENSMAYQTAIQQVTAQEQGEADEILNVIQTAYYINNAWFNIELFAYLIWLGLAIGIAVFTIWFIIESW